MVAIPGGDMAARAAAPARVPGRVGIWARSRGIGVGIVLRPCKYSVTGTNPNFSYHRSPGPVRGAHGAGPRPRARGQGPGPGPWRPDSNP